MKSTWFKTREHYDFARCLHDAGGYAHNLYDCFTTFLDITTIAFEQANRLFTERELCQTSEKTLIDHQMRYKHHLKFTEALGVLTMALEKEPHDFLGEVFHGVGLEEVKFRGQVFTPYHLSYVTAEMILQGVANDRHSIYNRLKIAEPACGAGSLVIAACEVLKKQGMKPDQFFITASDVDHKCVKMCFIQSYLLDIPVVVEQRNTLSRECWSMHPTLSALRYPLFDTSNPNACLIS